MRTLGSGAGLALGLIVACAGPAAAENVLRWAFSRGALTSDPHSANSGPDIMQQHPVYERLLDTSASLGVEPQLAVAWRPVDPVTWEFELREGVRFHDGAPFTADDVVFSLKRARAEHTQYAGYFAEISDIQAVNAHAVRVTTRAPDALLPDRLRKLFIMSKAWAEEHGVVRAADFASAEETYATLHANGTGPFILEAFEPGRRVVMRRNPDWWGGEHYPVNIDRIEFTPSLKLAQTTQLRSVWLGLDQKSPELRSSAIKGRNPFKDERVRQAIYQAIDIESIHDDVMQGLSVPAGMIIPPGVNGHSLELDQRLPHDPDAARTLLAEAGYAEGFSVTLDCPNNYYVNDEAICRAVAEQLGGIGLAVSVNAQPHEQFNQKLEAHEIDFWFESYTAATLDSLEVFDLFFRSGGAFNAFGYTNPEIDRLIEELSTASLTYARDALIEEAWRIVLDDIVFVPLHHQVLVWAMRESLDLPITPFNSPVFREARFKAVKTN
jgi:peptide/nickel transport system substrate-binding protein